MPILPSGPLGHDPEIAGHDPETAGHVRPKYAHILFELLERLTIDTCRTTFGLHQLVGFPYLL